VAATRVLQHEAAEHEGNVAPVRN
jgi:hypothetical protein